MEMMGDFFSSLASERSPITTFLTLVLFCAMLMVTWPAVKFPYKLSKANRVRAYWLILLYFVFAMNDGDWFHLYNLFQNSEFRSKVASDISSQAAGLEAAYYTIARFVNYHYLLFRFIVWGGAAYFSYLFGKRLGVNKGLYLFFFIIISLDIFSFQRGSLAMAMSFFGYSFFIYPLKRHRFVSIVIGLFFIVVSTLFHKSAIFLFPIYLLSFLNYSKRKIILVVISIPVLLYIVNVYLADFLMNMGTDGALNATAMQDYITSENRKLGIGSLIRNLLLPMMFASLLFYNVKHVYKKKLPLPKHIMRMFNCSCIIIIFSFSLLAVTTINVSTLYMRLMYFSVLPLSIVVSYIYGSYKNTGPINIIILICIMCTVYKIVLNLLGAIFLGDAGRT